MPSLSTAGTKFLALLERAVADAPRRDPLADKLQTLDASPPPVPSPLEPPTPPTCHCHECAAAHAAAQASWERFATWSHDLETTRKALWGLTFGSDPDEPGQQLLALCNVINGYVDQNRLRVWERSVEVDRRGRAATAFETATVIGEITVELVSLYRRAAEELVYLNSDELQKAIAEVRARTVAAFNRELRREVSVEIVEHVGTKAPAPAPDPGLEAPRPGHGFLDGEIRFRRGGVR